MKFSTTVYVLVLHFCFSDVGEASRALPNIGYAGRGYDIFRANPRPSRSLVDPGYVAAIVKSIDRVEDRESGDGRYLLPDRIEAKECQSCQQTMDVNEIASLDDFKKATDAKTEYSYKGFLFGTRTSSTYEEVVKQTTEMNHVLVDAEAKCAYYCASVRVYELGPDDLTLNFRRAVERLSTDNHLSYNTFAWIFGTHFITRVKMGSLFWQRTVHDKEEWADAKTEVKITEQKKSIFGTRQATTTVTHDEQTWVDTLAEKSVSRDIFSTGSDLNRTSTWIETAKNQPMPIGFSLYPISLLLTRKYFPNDPEIEQKRKFFEHVIENGSYCEFLIRASTGMQDIGGDCYNAVNKTASLAPAVGIHFAQCPTIFGGAFTTSDFSATGPVKNYLTDGFKCPDGYTANPVVQMLNKASSGIFYCTNGNHDSDGQFGGMFTSLTRRACQYEKYCVYWDMDDWGGALECVDWDERIVSCEDVEAIPSGEYANFTLTKNIFSALMACPDDGFTKVKLAYITLCTGACYDKEVSLNIYACYNSAEFVKGKSNLAGFSNAAARACPEGYSAKLVARSLNSTQSYACVYDP